VLASRKFVFRLVCVIKCLMISMDFCYYYLLSISFWICVCLHMLCIKVNRKQVGGEAHHDNRMEFDHENHEIQEVMDQGPHRPKLDPNGLRARPPGLLFGLASPL
jgi:hypothetical protein